MPARTRALRYQGPHRLELAEVELPDPAPGDALIRVLACGICGTDLHTYEGAFSVPLGQTLGHELAGEVVRAPGVEGLREGERVVVNPILTCGTCPACAAGRENLCHNRRGVIGTTEPGAFADLVIVPGARLGREVLPIPDGLAADVTALAEPLAVGLHAVNVSEAGPGDSVVVYGAGMIGLATVRWLAAARVARIVVVDPLALRRDAALRHGATAACDPADADAVAGALRDAGRPGKADVVIDCAGAPGLMETALTAMSPGGTLTLAAVRGDADTLSSMRVLFKEVTIRGSMAYTAPEFERARDHAVAHADELASLVSQRFALGDALAAFAAQADRGGAIKVIIQPEVADER